MRLTLSFVLAVILFGCQNPTSNNRVTQFNADSLVNALVQQLKSEQAGLLKTTSINDKLSKTEIAGDFVKWEQELEMFRSISQINKPGNVLSYQIKIESDMVSNLTIKTWRSRGDVPLQSLKIYYLNSPSQLKKLVAYFSQSTLLHTASKKMTLEFASIDSPPPLDAFGIEAIQKLIGGEEEIFYLKGLVYLK